MVVLLPIRKMTSNKTGTLPETKYSQETHSAFAVDSFATIQRIWPFKRNENKFQDNTAPFANDFCLLHGAFVFCFGFFFSEFYILEISFTENILSLFRTTYPSKLQASPHENGERLFILYMER